MKLLTALIIMFATFSTYAQSEDPYLWLEDVTGDRALEWVRERNAVTVKELEAERDFTAIRDQARTILDSKERIPAVTKRGKWLYNFWRDDANPRGLWRRTTLAEFRKPDTRWETVLDVDALAQRENENWVWGGAECLFPDYERCMLTLSRGGSDASVRREFDIATRSFVTGGFELPEAKSEIAWKDRDTLYVATDFGAGSLTESGYPRVIKEWKRGSPLSAAGFVYEGSVTDVAVSPSVERHRGFRRDFVTRSPTFFTFENYYRTGGKLEKLDVPVDARMETVRASMFVQLKSQWNIGGRSYPQGALLVIPFDAFRKGSRTFDVLFAPSDTKSLAEYVVTRNYVLVNELDDVVSHVYEWKRTAKGWTRREVAVPPQGNIEIRGLGDDEDTSDGLGDAYFLTHQDFLTPPTLYLARAGTDAREKLRGMPAFFDASGMSIKQFFATSRDGTRVPYFVVLPKDAAFDGKQPTLLYGYGGFEISSTPFYSGTVGSGWLARGGVYVVANIRGGGEYGPRWHQAALKEHRQLAFDDFIAVAEDLIARKLTSPEHLGIYGGSNGGLLVAAVMLQRPELFHAVVSAVPLLDMKRFNKLLAGASWVAEYGNPDDPKEWDYIARYSPYQNVKKDVKYPRVLFVTSTRDDRVHPGHARKMVARMLEQGHDVLYYENIEGGHAAAANNEQIAYRTALLYAFLSKELR
jgi:prolyl oligopeptidase